MSEAEHGIQFFGEEVDHGQPGAVREWLQAVAAVHGKRIGDLNYIFVNDEDLADMNAEYLDHDYYTDILTFPLHEPGAEEIGGDIYISVERVQENASDFGVPVRDELHRVMAHGVLHMSGLDDLDDESEAAMRKAEDYALSLRRF